MTKPAGATGALCLCLCLLLATVPCAAADWPHLRGPNLDGRVATSAELDRESIGIELAWSAPLGPGYSGVAVAAGRVVTLFSDGEADLAVAFDAATGERIWTYRIDETHRGHDGSDDGPLSSPVIDDGNVYGLGPRGQLFALRLQDGKQLWRKSLQQEFGATVPHFGFATTPLVEGNVLVVQTGGSDGRAISGLDKQTGKTLWSIGDQKVEYQSPSVLDLAGRRQIVAVSGKRIDGIDPRSGEILWSHELGEEDHAGTSNPTYAGKDRFFAAIGAAGAVFEVSKAADGYEVKEVFRSQELGNSYAAPVYHDGHLFGFRRTFLTCVNAETGERVWKSRPPGGRGLILVGDDLVIFGAGGKVVVAEATREGYTERASFEALEGTGYTWPSFADGKVFVRNLETIASVAFVDGSAGGAGRETVATGSHDFGRFVQRVAGASDKQKLIEEFMSKQDRFPIIEGAWAHFVYRGEVEDLALSGTMIGTGGSEAMERLAGTDLYHRTYRLDPAGRYEYQFTVDYDKSIPDPLNPRTVPGHGTTQLSEIVMPGYVEPTHLEEPEGTVRGTLETFEFESKILGNKREVTVYLPPRYQEADRAYPLLIVHQGKDWLEKGLMANTLDNLIGKRAAPIVVAFVQPRAEWWFEAGGTGTTEYARMLAEEFVPHLESKYRLIPKADSRGVMGTTYFGATAVYAALKYPEVFGKAALQSVGLGLGIDQELMELVQGGKPSALQLYLDWNRYETRILDSWIDFRKDTRALVRALEQSGFSYAGGEVLDSAGWGGWRARTDRILETLFPVE